MKKQIIVTITICILLSINIAPTTISTKQNKNQITNTFYEEYTISDFILDNYIQILMKIAHKPSIAAGIIYDDNLVWSKGYGFYDLENQKNTNEDILYLQASVSKTVTATALMQLYEKGFFELDDDVNDYLPFNLRNPNHPEDPITIKMILSHRSSLADDNLYWIALSYLPGDPDVKGFPYPWLEDYLVPGGNGYSSSTWSDAKPGENFYYANIGFSIIAYLVEIFSNQNFNEYCKENIFEPLQMYNSSFRLRDHNISNIAVPYEYKNGEYFRHPHYGIHILYPSITLRTSIEEFSHFIIAHMNGGIWNNVRILEEETVNLMHTTHFPTQASYNYGLGWFISYQENGNKIVSHSGGYVGVLDRVTIFIDDDIAVMFFSNELDSELLDNYIERRAVRAINNALINKAYQINE